MGRRRLGHAGLSEPGAPIGHRAFPSRITIPPMCWPIQPKGVKLTDAEMICSTTATASMSMLKRGLRALSNRAAPTCPLGTPDGLGEAHALARHDAVSPRQQRLPLRVRAPAGGQGEVTRRLPAAIACDFSEPRRGENSRSAPFTTASLTCEGSSSCAMRRLGKVS